ncbi:MAG: DUF349 domain-containing protein [Flavobacteriaceae bacterium]|nr:DUF349 domain-containing protein [Flavobacteriaceae bacterium]
MLDETKENSKAKPKKEAKPNEEVKEDVKTSKSKVPAPKENEPEKEVTTEVSEPVSEGAEEESKEDAGKEIEDKKLDKEDVKPLEEETKLEEKGAEDVLETVSKEVKDEVSDKKEPKPTTDKKVSKTKESASEDAPAAKIEKPVVEEKKELDKEEESTSKQFDFTVKDYDAIELEGLVDELENLVTNAPVNKIKDNIEALKKAFNTKFSTLLAAEKASFIEGGGNSIDFYFSTPYKSKYNALLSQFKKKRHLFYSQLELDLQNNLKIKMDIINSLKELIDNAEVKTMYNDFKVLQERWKKVGPIPRNTYNDSWQTYHHHVERFYDLLHLNKDLRDLDFKHNLVKKEKLIARAIELDKEKNIDTAFKELQQLHKIWKEDVGPVQKEIREEVWGRFSEATKVIHDKRHEAFKMLKGVFDENAAKKEAVINQIAAFNIENLSSHSDWINGIRNIEKLRDEFFKIGRVSRKQNEALWKKFKEATRTFNSAKNNFYKQIKKEQLDNLTKKRELLSKAQSLKDVEDLAGTVDVFKKIQADWKSIGHVPRKYSDKIWKEFKEACNHFFDRLHGSKAEDDKGLIEAFNNKKTYLEELKTKAGDADFKPTLEEIKVFVSEWKELGFVPKEMRHVEAKFNKLLEKLLSRLNLDKNKLVMLKFKMTIDSYKAADNFNKIDSEHQFLRKKIDEVSKEMQQLDNNMSFFSNTSDDNPLLKKVKNDIKKHQDNIAVLKEKLDYLRKL